MSGRGDRSCSLRSGAPAVIDAYRRILERAASRKQQTHSMIRKLRQLKPKELVQLFEELHEQAFMQIDCLSCANCCASVGPLLNEQDVQRAAKSLRMRTASSSIPISGRMKTGIWSSVPCPARFSVVITDVSSMRIARKPVENTRIPISAICTDISNRPRPTAVTVRLWHACSKSLQQEAGDHTVPS